MLDERLLQQRSDVTGLLLGRHALSLAAGYVVARVS